MPIDDWFGLVQQSENQDIQGNMLYDAKKANLLWRNNLI